MRIEPRGAEVQAAPRTGTSGGRGRLPNEPAKLRENLNSDFPSRGCRRDRRGQSRSITVSTQEKTRKTAESGRFIPPSLCTLVIPRPKFDHFGRRASTEAGEGAGQRRPPRGWLFFPPRVRANPRCCGHGKNRRRTRLSRPRSPHRSTRSGSGNREARGGQRRDSLAGPIRSA